MRPAKPQAGYTVARRRRSLHLPEKTEKLSFSEHPFLLTAARFPLIKDHVGSLRCLCMAGRFRNLT
jgi:hypothetical protein